MKKVIIIDDEKAGRTLLTEYLQEYPSLVIIAEANNGVDAVRQINEFKPDLIFLDVQMPGLSGFQVLTYLEEIPQVIFSTAYDKYALQAFEVHAVDYLLKPYTRERFRKSIERLPAGADSTKLWSLTDTLIMDKPNFPDRVLVNHNRKLISISVGQVLWIEAYGDYSKLHTMQGVYLSNHGISSLEERLDPRLFIRVHRSSIINIREVREINRYSKSFDIRMANDDIVRVSQSYMDKLKDLIL